MAMEVLFQSVQEPFIQVQLTGKAHQPSCFERFTKRSKLISDDVLKCSKLGKTPSRWVPENKSMSYRSSHHAAEAITQYVRPY